MDKRFESHHPQIMSQSMYNLINFRGCVNSHLVFTALESRTPAKHDSIVGQTLPQRLWRLVIEKLASPLRPFVPISWRWSEAADFFFYSRLETWKAPNAKTPLKKRRSPAVSDSEPASPPICWDRLYASHWPANRFWLRTCQRTQKHSMNAFFKTWKQNQLLVYLHLTWRPLALIMLLPIQWTVFHVKKMQLNPIAPYRLEDK